MTPVNEMERVMETYTVPADMIKAAQIMQADGDIRYYLNGIYLDKENGRVCGTNGHYLIVCEDDKFKDHSKHNDH